VWLLYGWWGYPVFNPMRSTAPFMTEVGERIDPNAELGLVDWKEQFLLLADRPTVTFGFSRPTQAQARAAAAWLTAGDNRWGLLTDRAIEPCFDLQAAIDMGERHREHWSGAATTPGLATARAR
jgi:hypothetical protein